MKNTYEIRGDITAILINSPKHGRLEALISTSKLKIVQGFPNSWYAAWDESVNTFYVRGNMPRINGKRGYSLLHRWITNAPVGMEVDHRNHDGLINTDGNLRVCTGAKNRQNRSGATRRSKSGIRGVSWNNQREKWRARITLDCKQIYLGHFTDLNEAERTVKRARLENMPFSNESA